MRLPCILTLASLLGAAGTTRANDFVLEGAFTPAFNVGSGSSSDTGYLSLGFSSLAGIEIERWGFGLRTHGRISNKTDFHVSAGSYDLKGSLARRSYGLEALARFFLLDGSREKRWFLEFGFMALEIDFIEADGVFSLAEEFGVTRLFLQGAGFTLGVGYRPRSGPWFYQLNYQLGHYNALAIVGDVNQLHPIFENPPLKNVYFIHSFFVTIGLDVFGRGKDKSPAETRTPK
jgi:hypothetical protein